MIEESVNKIFKEGKEAFNSIQNQKEFEEVLFEKNNSFGLIESKINTQMKEQEVRRQVRKILLSTLTF